jgi:myo-inositol-1-phosphate synthase
MESARSLTEDRLFDARLLATHAESLGAIEPRIKKAPIRGAKGPARDFVRRVQDDISSFLENAGARRAVVFNLATTEPPVQPDPIHDDLDRFEAALSASPAPTPSVLPPSVLYAYAALDLGIPYVNFAASAGSSLRALERLSLERGVPHAGADGKTGETLVKSALAPMFRMRNLSVKSWVGFNVLGNSDGLSLSEPSVAASKIASKSHVLPEILGYEPHSLVRIDFVPSLGDWKTAWNLIHFEGFLGTPMTLQLTWQGADSVLAAPLVIDLIRLIDLAARRGERGALGHLGFFFKSPLGCPVHDLSTQYSLLCEHVRCG